MEYETGKWMERLDEKLDAILVKLYPELKEKKEQNAPTTK